MKIVVTVKLVPDTNAEKRIDPGTQRLIRTGVETVLNPYDEYALEAALALKEKLADGSTVTVLAMAPEATKETLRKALAMGADDAVFLTDAALAGTDTLGTADILAHALKNIGFDLVVCGGLSDDGSTGGVPGALAEFLAVPGITNARSLEIVDGRVHAQRETDNGYQVVSAALPAMLSVTMAVGEPRYASLKGIMGAKKKTIAPMALADIGVTGSAGADGAKIRLLSTAPPPVRGKAKVVEATDGLSGAQAVLDFLKERKLV